jgi:hypothetical protein
MPCLCVDHPDQGELGEVIWACTSLTDGRWWFEWFHRMEQSHKPICPVDDTHSAARLVIDYLFEEMDAVVAGQPDAWHAS